MPIGGELFEKEFAIVLSVLGNQLWERSPLAELTATGGPRRLKPLAGLLEFNPTARAIVDTRVALEIGPMLLAASHQHADAVVGSRKNEGCLAGAQSLRSPAAQGISKDDRIIA